MLDSLRFLIDLQEIDLTLVRLKEKKENLPQMIEAVRIPYERASRDLEQAKNKQETSSKERRDREIQLEAEEQRLSKLKARTLDIKTNKEYQALLVEIETAKVEQGKNEETLLALMEQQETIKQEVSEKEKCLAEEKKKFEAEKSRLEGEAASAEKEIDRLEKERESLIGKIPEKLRADYEKIKSLRRDVAVVEVRNGTCLGCHIQILPQMVAELKKQNKILTCLNCHRILYWMSEPSKGQVRE